MLADMGHSTMLSYSTLLDILYQWREIAKQKNKNCKLLLVFEKDSANANKIVQFLTNPVYDSIMYNFYYSNIDDIEFFMKLREFKFSLDSVKGKKLEIEIKGFEFPFIDTVSEKEGDLWFVNKRDSLTANSFSSYYNKNNDINVLIYYGGAHLQKGFVEKPSKILTVQEKTGYYLANYLKKEYGDENVLTVSQIMKDSNLFRFTPFEEYIGKDILVKRDSIPAAWEVGGDMVVLRPNIPFPPIHRFNFLFSRKNIEYAAKRLEEKEKLLPGFDAKFECESILDKIYLISGFRFVDSKGIRQWNGINSFDGIERLKSDKFKEDLFNYYYEDPNNYIRKRRLNELGFGPGVYGKMIRKEEWKEFETELMKSVRFHNSVSIYLLGYPDEQLKAKEILVEFSGKDFPDAIQYLKWYRKEHYYLTY